MSGFVLVVKSESGDDYGPWIVKSRKTDAEVIEFLSQKLGADHPDLATDGPGILGTYLHVSWVGIE